MKTNRRRKIPMKKGYGIFGKAFEIMLRNDLHAPCSIDHKFLQ